MSSFFDEISSFSKSKLKPTSTKISYADGRQFLLKDGQVKEITDQKEQQISNNTIYWSNKLGYLVDLVPDLSIDEIIPNLYLSGDDVAINREILDSKKITHILNLTSNIPNKFEPEITYKKFLIYDLPTQKIFDLFEESFIFIDQALESKSNSILVHCNAGVSRSASFVIAYLMQKKISINFKQAYDLVKSKRSKICPNEGFINQLRQLESKLFNK